MIPFITLMAGVIVGWCIGAVHRDEVEIWRRQRRGPVEALRSLPIAKANRRRS